MVHHSGKFSLKENNPEYNIQKQHHTIQNFGMRKSLRIWQIARDSP